MGMDPNVITGLILNNILCNKVQDFPAPPLYITIVAVVHVDGRLCLIQPAVLVLVVYEARAPFRIVTFVTLE